jgi:lipid-A-disaccharide synthase
VDSVKNTKDYSSAKATVLFTAFEPSGDAHAAPVIAALKTMAPEIEIVAWGGPQMERAGATMIERTADDGSMGLSALSKIASVKKTQAAIRQWALARRVNVHVPVDSPAANFAIAKFMKARGVRVCHLVAPQLWAWGPWRLNKLRRCTDLVLCLLPFEQEWFRSRRVPAKFIGHPVINRILDQEQMDAQVKELPTGSPKVLLLPGSRSSEVTRNLPLLLKVFSDIQHNHRRAIAIMVTANDSLARLVRERVPTLPPGVLLMTGKLDAAISWSEIALCVSGTVSLDLLRQAKPMVGMYRTGLLSVIGGNIMLSMPNRLLPNILAGKRVVPEFVPCLGRAGPISAAVENLLADQSRLRETANVLRALLPAFQGKRPDIEAAEAIIAFVSGRSPLDNK